MSSLAIRVEGLGKRYRIGKRQKYKALRDTFTDALYAPLRAAASLLKRGQSAPAAQPANNLIWALRNVSFEVKPGEAVGIIGRNGAGKSTLLKILSRITEPTEGYAEIHGRVGSLLEVGTGFHPELTGRENIYLNGAILGMKKAEIDRKFDEIVSFSGVEKFIDTPLKHYSSGMYVRLAFAVAAHLELEILLVDEVLAVGDAAFQKKCLGKMGEVAQQGRTVLFVSHNMGMVTSLCQKAILLDSGQIAAEGAASDTVLRYYTAGRSSPHAVDYARDGRKVGDHLATLLESWIEDTNGGRTSEVDIRSPFRVNMRYELHENVPKPPFPNFHFSDARGEYAFVSAGNTFETSGDAGIYVAQCFVPGRLLNNGVYFIDLALTFTHRGIHVSFHEKNALAVSVRDPVDETLDDMRGGYSGPIPGLVRPQLEWRIEKES